ncbi:MAG TPA: hypothetical protein VEK56_01950 [Vicinamibacterales bacterium]|nr:hypothetical protein [Vicinamibacterales bacterium]
MNLLDTLPINLESSNVLRWVFQRDANAITCKLDMNSDRSFEMHIVPHWDVPASVIEHFESPADALLRHAEVARLLRENGWNVTGYSASPRGAAVVN